MQLGDIDLRLIRVFAAIVECGGLSAAELRLNIGKSTISSHLADLEGRLGANLCSRGRSGFELTEIGKATYEASLELFQQCDSFLSKVESKKSKISGNLSISILDMAINDPKCNISQVITKLKSTNNSFHIELNICSTSQLELAVLNGVPTIGIGVSRHPLRGLKYEHLFDEKNFLYCGKGHPLFNCNGATDDLLETSEYVSRGYMRGSDSFAETLSCAKTATAYHDKGIAHLILSGNFIGYLPEAFAQYWVKDDAMRTIEATQYFYHTPIKLITRESRILSKLEMAFIDEVRNFTI